jgi:GGDEF domain-containing protein
LYSIDRDGIVKSDGTEGATFASDTIVKDMHSQTSKQNSMVLKQVNLYGKQVVDKMIKENIPPTPANFAIYFEKLLEDKPLSQRQNINSVLELEEVEDFNYVLKIENNINEGFVQIKSMLDVISNVYTKINKLRTITKARKENMTKGSNNKISLVSYEEDLEAITTVLAKQQNSLKEQYTKIASVIKDFNNESIFDKKYDVYNKKYLFKTIDAEKANVKNFGYESTLLALRVKHGSLRNVRLTRDKELIIKTVGKMVLKRSRRSDVITHLQDGIFILILKHTDLDQAQKTISSIEQMISFSNYIVDSETIDIELDFAISKILPNKTKEQIIASALEVLPS